MLRVLGNRDLRLNWDKKAAPENLHTLGVFLDLKKAFDSMDKECHILILEGYGAGPRMIWLIRTFWRDPIIVCRASGNYGTSFKAGRGMTQRAAHYLPSFSTSWLMLLQASGS